MMSKILWNSLLVTPALLGASLVVAASVMAAPSSKEITVEAPGTVETEQPQAVQARVLDVQPATTLTAASEVNSAELDESAATKIETATPVAPTTPAKVANLEQVQTYSNEPVGNSTTIAQVTSVSQLSDVQPTDWAFQALQSLVERYGCIVGYPDSTYRGNRALTRYEFAAGLNACMDRVNELIAAGTANLVTKEDLATLQRLQEEFAAELATLRGRVDALEAQTAELEANQFSTTTKLNGEAIFAVADAFGGAEPVRSGATNDTASAVLIDRVRLSLDTSFTGKDRLRTRLNTGNGAAVFSRNSLPGNEGRLAFADGTDNSFNVDWLEYRFPLGKNTRVYLEATVPGFYDFVDPVSPFASSGSGAVSRFGRFNPLYRNGGAGRGAGLSVGLGNALKIEGGYLAREGNDPSAGAGLFSGDYAALGQLVFTPSDRFKLALTYVNGYSGTNPTPTNPLATVGIGEGAGSINSDLGNFGPVSYNSYGAAANFGLSKYFEIGGWVGYTNARAFNQGDADVWNYALTLAFPDLGKEGNLGGVVVGVEPRLAGVRGTVLSSRVASDPDTGLHVEGFYRYRLNDNIAITPGVIWLTAPNHRQTNDDVVIGVLRTTFTF